MNFPEKVIDLCKMLDSELASDIVIFDTTKMKNAGDYYILATAESVSHVKELSDYICEETQKDIEKFDEVIKEGFNLSEWVVLNFDKVFVEIFTKEEREHFNLEKLLNEGGNLTTYKKLLKQLQVENKKSKETKQDKKQAKKKDKEVEE